MLPSSVGSLRCSSSSASAPPWIDSDWRYGTGLLTATHCATPNRLTGPHDISVYFDQRPTGLHMREYDHRSLARIFRAVGFSAVRATVSLKGRVLNLPVSLASAAESLFELLPISLRTRLALIGPVSNIAGVNLVGVK